MKKTRTKGKTVEEAIEAALGVLGGTQEGARVVVINEGKRGILGGLGSEDAEVEVTIKTNPLDDAKDTLQAILDKMGLMAVAEAASGAEGQIELNIKGEDLGRIIGKDGAALKALEILVSAILGRLYEQGMRVGVDAGEYKSRRIGALKRLAEAAAKEVESTGRDKELPALDARDRREIHIFLKDNPAITTFSKGEGKDRRLVIAPR